MALTLLKKHGSFLALLQLTMLAYAVMYAPQPLLSRIQTLYPTYSDANIALVMTLVLIPLAIAPLIYGAFLHSFDTKVLLQVCVIILGISCFGIYFTSAFGLLLFFRIVQGLVIPAVLTCIMAHISAKFQDTELQKALALYIAVNILGGLVGRVGSGAIATLVGWKIVFLLLAVSFMVMFLPLNKLQKTPHAAFAHVDMTEFKDILRTPGVKNLLFIDCIGFFSFAALATYMPFIMSQIGDGISEWRISLVYIGYGIGILIALASRRISHTLGGDIRTIRIGFSIYMCAMALFLTQQIWCFFLGMFLVCTGQFLEHSISPGLINRMSDKDKGAVNGLYLSVYYAGGSMGSYLPGFVYELWGWNIFIGVLSFILVGGLLATLGLERHVPR